MNPPDAQLARSLLKYFRGGRTDQSEKFFKKIHADSAGSGEIRAQLTELLRTDFTKSDLPLIRFLFDNELASKDHFQDGETLYQLAYFLYVKGEQKDVYRIFSARFQNENEASASRIDEDMFLMGKRASLMMRQVEKDFSSDPELKERYGEILTILENFNQQPSLTQSNLSGALREFIGDKSPEELSDFNISKPVILSSLTAIINFESELEKKEINFHKEESTDVDSQQTLYYFSDEDHESVTQLVEKVIRFEAVREEELPLPLTFFGRFSKFFGSFILSIYIALMVCLMLYFLGLKYLAFFGAAIAFVAHLSSWIGKWRK